MYEDEAPPAMRNRPESLDSIKRLDLLNRRFSEEEIQRLSALQLRQGERPDVLDRSIQEGRLTFVRWLVEHGRLGEGDEADGKEASQQKKAPGAMRPQESWPGSSGTTTAPAIAGASAGSAVCERMPEQADEKHQDHPRSPLLCVWKRIRQGLARVAGIGSRLGSWVFLPREGYDVDPSQLRDPYGNLWSYTEDPWPWTHFHSGW
jgi:hypothetical protein